MYVDLLPELGAHIKHKYVRQKAAALAWGVSDAFVSAVLNGKKRPTEAILADAGLVRVVVYKRAEPE